MTKTEIRALEMWREREMRFPRFTRRMTPEAFDIASGAWSLILDQARAAATNVLPAQPETGVS